jgi:LPS export ABC transporter protein LptC
MFMLFCSGKYRSAYSTTFSLLLLAVLMVVGACNNQNRAAKKIAQDTQQAQEFDNSLTLQSVTLDEFDKQGRLWWRVKAKEAIYSKDKKIAQIKEPKGDFYQDGKSILQVSAKSGEVQQDGKTIFLRGDITATDTRDGLVMKGNELEWQPEKDLLIVRNSLTGKHKQLSLVAKEGRYYSRLRKIELMGQVAVTTVDPQIQLRSEKLVWLIQKQTITSDRPLQVDHYKNKVVTDRATANQGMVDLKAKTATLKQNAQISFSQSGAQLNGNALVWNLNNQTVASDEAITVINQQQQLTIVANKGNLDLKSNTAYMSGNVQGVSAVNQARVNCDRLTWNLTTQQFQADGNVVYQQTKPPLNLTGPRATGGLREQKVVVSGGRVETEFIP